MSDACHNEFAIKIETLIRAGEWQEAVRLGREWYSTHCPRYTKDEVEIGLGSIGTWLITWDQLKARTRIKDEKDRHRLTPEQAEKLFRQAVISGWNEKAMTYRRACDRWDSPKPVEESIRSIVRNIAARPASYA